MNKLPLIIWGGIIILFSMPLELMLGIVVFIVVSFMLMLLSARFLDKIDDIFGKPYGYDKKPYETDWQYLRRKGYIN